MIPAAPSINQTWLDAEHQADSGVGKHQVAGCDASGLDAAKCSRRPVACERTRGLDQPGLDDVEPEHAREEDVDQTQPRVFDPRRDDQRLRCALDLPVKAVYGGPDQRRRLITLTARPAYHQHLSRQHMSRLVARAES